MSSVSPNGARTKKKPLAPRRSPEDLAELFSCLSNQQQSEFTYELILFSARAAADGDGAVLNAFLAELEDIAEVYADPERRRELQEEIEHSSDPDAQAPV